MSELKRWLDEASDADDFERAVLRSGLDRDPPESKSDEVWARVVATLALSPPRGGRGSGRPPNGAPRAIQVAASAGSGAAIWLGVGKGLVVGLALCGLAAGVREIYERARAPEPAPSANRRLVATPAPRPTDLGGTPPALPISKVTPALPAGSAQAISESPARANATSEASARAAQTQAQLGSTTTSASKLPSVSAFADPEPTPRPADSAHTSQLQAEAAALRRARAELHAGQLADAFATLEASRRQFSAPQLYQERGALMIELLERSGQMPAAVERAREFLTRFPDSPHAAQMRQIATQR